MSYDTLLYHTNLETSCLYTTYILKDLNGKVLTGPGIELLPPLDMWYPLLTCSGQSMCQSALAMEGIPK